MNNMHNTVRNKLGKEDVELILIRRLKSFAAGSAIHWTAC